MIEPMIDAFKSLADPTYKIDVPMTFEWREKNLSIVIDNLAQEMPCHEATHE